jgi:hypothetical protein
MELLGDVHRVEPYLVRLERVLVLVQDRCKISVRLEIVLVSVQDRCVVCAECTVGSEIILDAPDGTPR